MDKISVVIPCRNEEKYISECLDSLIKSVFPNENMEILVVDGVSNDNTMSIVKKYSANHPFIKLIINKNQITPAALNLGVKNATNEYILIASAHSKFSKNYISVLIDNIKKLKADGVGGIMITEVKTHSKKTESIVKVLTNKFGVGNSMFRIGISKPVPVDTVPFGLYKKELYYNVGFYNENLIRNHDIEWSKRLLAAGKKIYLIPEATCTYFARKEYKTLAKNNFDNGYWNILTVFITRKISSLSLRHFVPLIFLLSLVIPTLMSILYFPLIFISLFSALLYLISVGYISIKLNNQKTNFLYLVYTFIILHLSYGFGSLSGLFRLDMLFKKIR